jgi:hypothetical protein
MYVYLKRWKVLENQAPHSSSCKTLATGKSLPVHVCTFVYLCVHVHARCVFILNDVYLAIIRCVPTTLVNLIGDTCLRVDRGLGRPCYRKSKVRAEGGRNAMHTQSQASLTADLFLGKRTGCSKSRGKSIKAPITIHVSQNNIVRKNSEVKKQYFTHPKSVLQGQAITLHLSSFLCTSNIRVSTRPWPHPALQPCFTQTPINLFLFHKIFLGKAPLSVSALPSKLSTPSRFYDFGFVDLASWVPPR